MKEFWGSGVVGYCGALIICVFIFMGMRTQMSQQTFHATVLILLAIIAINTVQKGQK